MRRLVLASALSLFAASTAPAQFYEDPARPDSALVADSTNSGLDASILPAKASPEHGAAPAYRAADPNPWSTPGPGWLGLFGLLGLIGLRKRSAGKVRW